MFKKISFLTFFLILFFISSSQAYEYYTFAQEVPATVCKVHKCNAANLGNLRPNLLNIHGLWPDTANPADRPFNCQENLYDESKLDANTKQTMDKFWVGLYNSTFWFRSHEWGKHGTCWNDDQSNGFLSNDAYYDHMNHFFRKALDVKQSLNLEQILYNGQSQNTFNLNDLVSKIGNLVNVNKFYIHCQNISGQQYLDCVNICLDLNYQPVDCPDMENKCKQNLPVIVPNLG